MVVTVGTFDVSPELVSVRAKRRGLRTPHDSGMVQRRQVQSSASRYTNEEKTRAWSLGWRNARWQDVLRIQEADDASVNGCLPLTWEPPDEGAEIAVRIVPKTLEIRRATANRYEVDLELEEWT